MVSIQPRVLGSRASKEDSTQVRSGYLYASFDGLTRLPLQRKSRDTEAMSSCENSRNMYDGSAK